MTQFAIDFKGHENLVAQEIPSAVNMRGLYIGAPLGGEYDFYAYRFEQMIRDGVLRPACYIGHRHACHVGASRVTLTAAGCWR